MKRMVTVTFGVLVFSAYFAVLPHFAHAGLIDQVNQAFRSVHGRNPTQSEWGYWAGRVQRGEKTSYVALGGAMAYQKGNGGSVVSSAPVNSGVAASSFKIDKKYYPSSHNPNFLPDGSLVKSVSSPNVFYVASGKKSWVIPRVLNVWLNENHFFKGNIIHTISDSDLARYTQRPSSNPLYVGKVLKHPNGAQFYIDDKLRKRPLSSSVRSALKFPAGNLYPTSLVHLQEFKTGPALKADKYPGGMTIYDGPWHGGRMWKIEEVKGGVLTKRLFLTDYLYEAWYYPDESQRVGVSATMLAKYIRGPNISAYPDGYPVGIGNNIYVVKSEKLRLVTSPSVFAALGYKAGNVRREHQTFLKRYATGQPIRAFKNVVDGNGSLSKGAPKAAPSTASNLTKVRPAVRTLISQINTIALSVYDI